jgi:Mn-dependent DtxR family transcriptional regulator
LSAGGLLEPLPHGRYRLTASGRQRAARVVRAYRLWQRFLERNPDLASTLVDLDAEALEEQLSPEVIRDLETELAATGRLPAIVG